MKIQYTIFLVRDQRGKECFDVAVSPDDNIFIYGLLRNGNPIGNFHGIAGDLEAWCEEKDLHYHKIERTEEINF